MMKKFLFFILSALLVIGCSFSVYATNVDFNEIINISLNGDSIEIPDISAVASMSSMNNGSTEDKGIAENVKIANIINITEPGNYKFSGTLNDGQISVDANKIKGDVNIILNNANITCENAPAIFVYSKDVNNTECNVTITTLAGTINTVTGGRLKVSVIDIENQDEILYSIEKNYDDNGEYYERYKYDGAISSDISSGE